MMRHKIIALSLAGAMLLGSGVYAATNERIDENLKIAPISAISQEYNIETNGVALNLPEGDNNAFLKSNDDVMVPLRAIAEALGYEVKWDGETRSIELNAGNQWTKLYIGKDQYFFARIKPFPLGEAPEIINDRTFVPLDFFKEILKANVSVEDTTIKIVNVFEEFIPNISYNFDNDLLGFEAGFADLPIDADTEEFYELDFQYKEIPVKDESKGIYLTGNNHSDDLFMYTYKNIGTDLDLEPNTKYAMDLSFEMATNVPAGMGGIGGAPGESVYVKAGIVSEKPNAIVDENQYYRLNIDKGNQSEGGKEISVIGNVSKSDGSEDLSYAYKHFEITSEIETDSEGNAFVIIGLDSGFEGKTEVYLDDIRVGFSEIGK